MKFKKDDKVKIKGWFSEDEAEFDGVVIKDCEDYEGTCLVLIDKSKRGIWVPVDNVKKCDPVERKFIVTTVSLSYYDIRSVRDTHFITTRIFAKDISSAALKIWCEYDIDDYDDYDDITTKSTSDVFKWILEKFDTRVSVYDVERDVIYSY